MTIENDHDLILAIHQNIVNLGNRTASIETRTESIETRTKEMRDKINIVEYTSNNLALRFSEIHERQKLYEQLFDEFRRNHELEKQGLEKKISEVVNDAVKNRFIIIWNRILKTIVYAIIAIIISLTLSFSKDRYPVIEKILKGVSTTL